MIVDFPAPFSPTIAWIVPRCTEIETSLFAVTSPKVFVMLRNSSMFLFGHCVGHLNIAGDDLLFRFFGFAYHFGCKKTLIVLIHRISDAVLIKPKDVKPSLELPSLYFLNNIEY